MKRKNRELIIKIKILRIKKIIDPLIYTAMHLK